MEQGKVVLRFEGLSSGEAGVEVRRLKEAILDTTPDVQATVERGDAESMDAGTILSIVLATPAIIEVAKGIAAFLNKRGTRSGRLVVERPGSDGRVERWVWEGDSPDVASVAAALGPVGSAAKQA